MSSKEKLLSRLDQIGVSLKNTNMARALLGFGSSGIETDRLDEYSDLDFLVVAKNNCKWELLKNLDWLMNVAEVRYSFMFTKDTRDGYKVFFSDGIFCEFGVLEEEEAKTLPHSEGRIIWCEDDFNRNMRLATKSCEYDSEDPDWSIGELITNLYVGLCRYARGELLTASKYIQGSALDHLLSCSRYITNELEITKDAFQNDRRFERRYPLIANELPGMMQGYEKSPESALAILYMTKKYFTVNSYLYDIIETFANKLIRDRGEVKISAAEKGVLNETEVYTYR